MIDRALLYKERYNEAERNNDFVGLKEYAKFKDADKYDGWREVCAWFSGLFDILNSSVNRLDNDQYSDNLQFLRNFLQWFLNWKVECIAFKAKTLPHNPTAYQSLTGFFTYEASEDCITMLTGIIQMTEYYCSKKNRDDTATYFLPRRISQDLVENGFSRIRLSVGHGRLDHKSTMAACVNVNVMKEVKSSSRSMKKRNANGSQKITVDELPNNPELFCTEYAKNLRKQIMKEKFQLFNEKNAYTWHKINGKDCMRFNHV